MKKVSLYLMCLFSSYAWCESPADVLQNKLNAIHAMTANFTQVVKAKKRDVSHSSGTMALQRPGHFRWQTKDPMQQLIVADGQKMWVYDPDLEQVTVKKQDKGMGSTAALFLSGYDDSVTKNFDVTQSDAGSTSTFDLKAKSSKDNFQRMKLTFVQNNLTGIELYDQLGQVTQVQLGQIKSNPTLAPKLFQFKPPKGVDVVQQ